MTTNMQEIIERAYELGRRAERQKIADLASVIASDGGTVATISILPRPGRVAKVDHTQTFANKTELKASKVAHGAKKTAAPRTKGVKEAIVNMLGAAEGLSVDAIISKSGFKEGSVRAALMGLREAGRAIQDGNKLWSIDTRAEASHDGAGNSDGEAHVSA